MEIILNALPDQDAAPYSSVIDQQYKCESCNQNLILEESFRILDDYVSFYTEPYFTCKCKGFIWLSFLKFKSRYVSQPEVISTLINYDGAVMNPSVIEPVEEDELVKGTYSIPEDAGTIRVKITDLLSESLEVTVE